jgi:hypothetical protein
MAANWWFAFFIMLGINGSLVWALFVAGYSTSRREKKWNFIIFNAIALIFAGSQFFWLEF